MTEPSKAEQLERIRAAIVERRRFVLSSHARPDGDSIGSQLALAFALRALGKDVRLVNRDAPPAPFMVFPGAGDIEVAGRIEHDFDAAVVLECGDLDRTGVEGLDRGLVINIDHHAGNTMYGAINWFDDSVSACGEMVFDVIEALGVPLSADMATHLYVAILTDTGGFHYSGITARTFEICRRAVEAGAQPAVIARAVYDNHNLGRIRLLGSLLNAMELVHDGRLAILYMDEAIAEAAKATSDDTDGLINVPLTAGQVEAVAFFRPGESGEYRVSLRSKGDIDVGAAARRFGGGGHKNAAGCSVAGDYETAKALLVTRVIEELQSS
jgi:phosphoesterase RecJ-like protein